MKSINKVSAIYIKQMKNFSYNAFILIGLIMAPAMAFLLANFMPIEKGYALEMGILVNIVFGGANTICVLIAEEKEKNTLNVLITSTVSAMEFLLSNALATLTVTVLFNVIIYGICGVNLSFALFMLVTTISSLASILLGAIIGLVSKNQMSASCIITPFALILMMIPMFSEISPTLEKISNILFTGQNSILLAELARGNLSWWRIGVIFANIFVFCGAFALVYKKVGLAK